MQHGKPGIIRKYAGLLRLTANNKINRVAQSTVFSPLNG